MGLVTVTNQITDEYGECYECGDPALFIAPYLYWNSSECPDSPPPVTENNLLCGTHAAYAACEGEVIMACSVEPDVDGEPMPEHQRALNDLGISF